MTVAFKLELKVDQAFSACRKKLDSYLDTHDKPVRRALELRIKVAANTALSWKALGIDVGEG